MLPGFRSSVRALIFFLSFSIEVRVHAELLWEPSQCGKNLSITAVNACIGLSKNGLSQMELPSGFLRLAQKSVVVQNSKSNFDLVTGTIMIESKTAVTIKHLFGQVKVEDAAVILVATRDGLEIFPIKNVIQYRPRGSEISFDLTAGYTQNLGRVKSDGVARMVMPRPVEVSRLVDLWVAMTPSGEGQSLIEDVRGYRDAWQMAVDGSGPWYKDLADRQIASLAADREAERRRQEAAKREQNFLREMFRRRNFVE